MSEWDQGTNQTPTWGMVNLWLILSDPSPVLPRQRPEHTVGCQWSLTTGWWVSLFFCKLVITHCGLLASTTWCLVHLPSAASYITNTLMRCLISVCRTLLSVPQAIQCSDRFSLHTIISLQRCSRIYSFPQVRTDSPVWSNWSKLNCKLNRPFHIQYKSVFAV